MVRSRRPELEKDNPVAPQMYVGRSRRSIHRDPAPSRSDDRSTLGRTLQTLTDAAERFVNGVPRWKKKERDRQALLDAITQAQLVLSVRDVSSKRPAR